MQPKLRYAALLIGICTWLISGTNLSAQSSSPPWQWTTEMGSSLSFTGLNIHLSGVLRRGKHALVLGPKWVLSDSFLIQNGPWGWELAYRWYLLESQRLRSFARAGYQGAFLGRTVNRRQIRVHEVHAGYGLEFQLGPRLALGNTLGLGWAIERSRDRGRDEVFGLDGFSVLGKVYLGWRW
ncbi:MAG: hypothetical protein AAFW73_09300 [Bacteroidota bacterium]